MSRLVIAEYGDPGGVDRLSAGPDGRIGVDGAPADQPRIAVASPAKLHTAVQDAT